MSKKIHVLFVCLGNICRSPAAEGVFRHKLNQINEKNIEVSSCGIGIWHAGKPADQRMREASLARGISLDMLAKQFKMDDFDRFDFILAADNEVMKYLYSYAKTDLYQSKLMMMTEFSKEYKGMEIPDPYFEPETAFNLVLDMLEDACEGLIAHIKKNRA